jgi:hypothetical protein
LGAFGAGFGFSVVAGTTLGSLVSFAAAGGVTVFTGGFVAAEVSPVAEAELGEVVLSAAGAVGEGLVRAGDGAAADDEPDGVGDPVAAAGTFEAGDGGGLTALEAGGGADAESGVSEVCAAGGFVVFAFSHARP